MSAFSKRKPDTWPSFGVWRSTMRDFCVKRYYKKTVFCLSWGLRSLSWRCSWISKRCMINIKKDTGLKNWIWSLRGIRWYIFFAALVFASSAVHSRLHFFWSCQTSKNISASSYYGYNVYTLTAMVTELHWCVWKLSALVSASGNTRSSNSVMFVWDMSVACPCLCVLLVQIKSEHNASLFLVQTWKKLAWLAMQ